MKKIAAVLFAFLVLLSGINLSIASHLCDGKLVNIKVSINNEKALPCKMDLKTSVQPNGFSKKNCCSNDLKVLSTDRNYTSSSFDFKFSPRICCLFNLPSVCIMQKTDGKIKGFHNAIPPDSYLFSKIELEDICVYII